MKEYIIKNKKGLILVFIGLLLLTSMLVLHSNKKITKENIIKFETNIDIREPETKKELTDDELIEIYLSEKDETINFLANTFQMDNNIIKERLKKEQGINLLDIDNFDYFLIEYLLKLEETEKELFNNQLIPCTNEKAYIVALIKYFTNIYYNVDFSIAAGIAQIESNYTATSMLNKNNVFGGMYNGSLIKYKNIEYGILKYIKLLNDGYFSKGLTTVSTIGKIYNPTYDANGNKVAKPSWVINVTNAMEEFTNYNEEIDITTLNSLKTIS